MKRELIVIPKIKIHPSQIILYNEIHWTPTRPSRKESFHQDYTTIQVEVDGKVELKKVSTKFLNSTRKSNGKLSKMAIKKLKLSIEYFLTLNKPQNGKSGFTGRHYQNQITFITLTLPSSQKHTDNEIKSKCLNQILVELTKYHHVTQYVWRSEYQKNGNIHFHILVNKFVPWNELRNRWNRIINKLGYVDEYRKSIKEYHANGFQVRADLLKTWPLEQQKKAYKEGVKHDWNNPNSIDVHKVYNILNIKNYLTKYLTLNEVDKLKYKLKMQVAKMETEKATQEQINNYVERIEEEIKNLDEQLKNPKEDIGRIWAASTSLSNITGACTEVDSNIEKELLTLEEHFNNNFFKSDYYTVISITIETIETMKCLELLNLFFRYMLKKFNYSHQFAAPI